MHRLLYVLILAVPTYTQLVSPCPKWFKYEPSGQEKDRWFGTVTLQSDSELSGVWLRLIFDKPSVQLGNWFGEVVTEDNKEYLIKNRNHKLLANTPFPLRFYIKYNVNDGPPQLKVIRLNAKTVCPENGGTTEAPVTTGQLITSSILSTTEGVVASGSQNGGTLKTGVPYNRKGQHDDRPVPGTMHRLLYVLILAVPTYTQLVSPCPKWFKYEPSGQERDRWFGTVTLQTDSELSGVWLKLILDKPSIQLGNWFGEVVTEDNKEYLIKNRNHKLLANTPFPLRFYIKYNVNESPPQLKVIRLNAKTVCPENGGTTEAPVTTGHLLTSSILSTTEGVVAGWGQNGGTFPRPSPFGPQTPDEDDDFFQGDFAIFTKPKPQGAGLNDVTCGTVVMPPRPLITHGQATHEGEFPWHAALYHAKGIDLTYICGASLISRFHLLTVAHCVTKRKSSQPLDPSSLVVYLGKYYLKRWSNAGIQDKHVERITVHPQYNSNSFSNDIAVIKVTSPVEITNYVRPVCLWNENVQLQAVINKAGTVVGWGFDETGRVTEQLTKAKMPIVSQETCIFSFPDFYSRFTSNKTFCAGFKNGTSVCNGDSGGGMVFPRTGSNPNTQVWQLRGLVSISVALQNQLKCDSTHYVVFTDVAKYLDWIQASLN